VETVVPKTMFLPSPSPQLVITMPFHAIVRDVIGAASRIVRLGTAAAVVVAAAAGRADVVEPPPSGVEEAAFTDSPILELPSSAVPVPTMVPEELAAPAPTVAEESRLGPPAVLDASVQSADGMFLDQLELDEMPYEASSGRWFWSGGWYLGAESLWMHRSREDRQTIFEDVNNTGVPRDPIKYYSTGQPFNVAPGARITLGKSLGRDQLVMSPGGNWSRHAERGFLPALIVGTRVARVAEDFWMQTSRENAVPPVPLSTFGGTYTVGTDNWLLGLNLGAELISQNEFYYWGLRGRAAPSINFASTDQAARGVNNTTTPVASTGSIAFTDAASQNAASFIGDLTLMAGWNVTPNFALQVGWDFLWVAGIATAERQLNLDDREFNDIDTSGDTFFNGLSFGFYGSW
jgi:hypothetical protein